jgi:ATP sulfurylase
MSDEQDRIEILEQEVRELRKILRGVVSFIEAALEDEEVAA